MGQGGEVLRRKAGVTAISACLVKGSGSLRRARRALLHMVGVAPRGGQALGSTVPPTLRACHRGHRITIADGSLWPIATDDALTANHRFLGHCGHGPIFIAQRSVANDPGCVRTTKTQSSHGRTDSPLEIDLIPIIPP